MIQLHAQNSGASVEQQIGVRTARGAAVPFTRRLSHASSAIDAATTRSAFVPAYNPRSIRLHVPPDNRRRDGGTRLRAQSRAGARRIAAAPATPDPAASLRCSPRCPRSSRTCRRRPAGCARRRCRLVRCARARATRGAMRRARSGCSRSSAPTRSPRSASPTRSRGSRRGCAIALLPDWETLPYDQFSPHQDLVSERLATLYRVSRGECDVLVVAATTALYRLAPPSYLAAFTFFLKQGDAARRRRAARAARARRLPARHAGRLARRVQRARRAHRPLPDGQRAALSARSLRRRHREHQDVRRRHAAHALSGARRAPAARARVSAGRGGAHALPQPLSRGVRGRPVEVAAVQGREQRRRAGRHRVLPAAVLRGDGDARRLPAARRRRRAASATSPARSSASGRTPSRATGSCAATRRGRCCRPTERLPAARRVQRRAEAVRAHRIATADADAAGDADDRRRTAAAAGRPPRRRSARGAQALPRRERHARADLRRKRGPPRDDAAVFRRIRSRAAARRRLRPAFLARRRAASRSACAPLHAGFAWPAAKLAFVTEAELYAGVVRRGRRDGARGARTSTRCCATSPRCASATRSSTSSTASAATSAS